jgi:hypothetical protein
VLSKVWLVGSWSIYQGVIWTIARSLRDMGVIWSAGFQTLLPTAIIFTLIAFVGGLLGLLVSASSRTGTTTGWVLLLTVPLLLFLFDPLSHWSILAIINLLLMVLLAGIQSRVANAGT